MLKQKCENIDMYNMCHNKLENHESNKSYLLLTTELISNYKMKFAVI